MTINIENLSGHDQPDKRVAEEAGQKMVQEVAQGNTLSSAVRQEGERGGMGSNNVVPARFDLQLEIPMVPVVPQAPPQPYYYPSAPYPPVYPAPERQECVPPNRRERYWHWDHSDRACEPPRRWPRY